MSEQRGARRGVEYEQVGSEYLEQRQLKRGAAGWVLLAGLGVAYVISGDFAGWNFGLAEGGWGGLLVATILMGTMYTCMVFALAELSSTISTAGGGYGFGRRALGPWGGFLTGTAILIEYAIAPAAIVVFIGAYVEALDIGISAGWPVYLAFYAVFVGIHLIGVGEALKLTFAITAIAVVALVVFVVVMIPEFDSSNLTNIEPTDAAGVVGLPAVRLRGHLGGVPVRDLVLPRDRGRAARRRGDARPEARHAARPDRRHGDPARLRRADAVHRPGRRRRAAGDGVRQPAAGGDRRGQGRGQRPSATSSTTSGSLGLVASFFSIIFAYSRQLFALSRAGYLPRGLSVTGGRKVPVIALLVPAVIGFLLAAITEDGATMINIAVFGATVSYVLMMLSHIVLRSREPNLERPYRTPGGVATSGVALVLAVLAVVATFLVDEKAALITLGVYAAAALYFFVYSRHHLVASAPEEEFEAIESAERELAGA